MVVLCSLKECLVHRGIRESSWGANLIRREANGWISSVLIVGSKSNAMQSCNVVSNFSVSHHEVCSLEEDDPILCVDGRMSNLHYQIGRPVMKG